MKIIVAILFFFNTLLLASESDLIDPLDEFLKNKESKLDSIAKKDSLIKDKNSSLNTNNSIANSKLESNESNIESKTESNLESRKVIYSNNKELVLKKEHITEENIVLDIAKGADFKSILKEYGWIKSVGLLMVGFDDGAFKSGFGVLLPKNTILTSAELAQNGSAYPRYIYLKMRDESAGNLICIASLNLKAMDKAKGLALFEIANYTDDYCNIRSKSVYHADILNNNAYKNLAKQQQNTHDFYTVTTHFGNPSIAKYNIKSRRDLKIDSHARHSIVFGRPFFSKSGDFLGIATMVKSEIRPVVVSKNEVKDFICSLKKDGFSLNENLNSFCFK